MANKLTSLFGSLAEGIALSQGVPESMLSRNLLAAEQEAALKRREREAAVTKREMDSIVPPENEVDLNILGVAAEAMRPAREKLAELRHAPLDQEGINKRSRLNAIEDAKREKIPRVQKELDAQLEDEYARADLESHVIKPITIEDEAQHRIKELPDGSKEVLQHDGRIEVNDKKAIEQMKLDHQERTHIQELQFQAEETRRNEKAAEAAEKKKKSEQVEAKLKEEQDVRWRKHREQALADKPMNERYLEAKKMLEDADKRLNPKRPARKYTPAEITHVADSLIEMDFQAMERTVAPRRPELEGKMSPWEKLQARKREDPEEFREEYEKTQKSLQLAKDDVTPTMVLEEMIKNSDDGLDDLIESQIQRDKAMTRKIGSTSPSPNDLMEFNRRGIEPTDEEIAAGAGEVPMLRSLFGKGPAEPSSPSDLVGIQVLKDTLFKKKIDIPAEELITDRALRAAEIAGSDDPVAFVSKGLSDALNKGKTNYALMPQMDRAYHDHVGTPTVYGKTWAEVVKQVKDAGLPPGSGFFDEQQNFYVVPKPKATAKKASEVKGQHRRPYSVK